MLIKDQQGRGSFSGAMFSGWLPKLFRRWRWIVALALLAIVFVSGIAFQRAGLVGPLVSGFLTNTRLPIHVIRGSLADVDRLTFDITYDNFQKLNYKRQQALERGILVTDDDSWVSAQIRYNGAIMRCKIRLKGDLPDHLTEDQWSLRVNLRDDSTLYGMKRFSLQNPGTRNYIHEWIFHQAAKREGLIALRYHFVNVTINGEEKGLYALEESFEKRLLENNQRREAPIIKFNEDPWWVESGGYVRDYALPGAGHYYSLPIDMFQTNKTLADSALARQFSIARDLLEGFRNGELGASDVFDIEQQAKYFALIDLLGGFHALNTIQLRFYFNPITAKLEPIAFDANAGRLTPEISALFKPDEENPWTGDLRQRYTGDLFADRAFFRHYLRELDRFSQPEYLESLFSALDETLTAELDRIYSDHPEYSFERSVYETNRLFIRSFLEPVSGVIAHLQYSGVDTLTLQIAATQELPIEITTIEFADQSTQRFSSPLFIPGKELPEPGSWTELRIKLTDGSEDRKATAVRYRVLGLTQERTAQLTPWTAPNVNGLSQALRSRDSSLERYDFLVVDERAATISVTPGRWRIDGILMIPAGYRFLIGPGTALEFSTHSSQIISYSPLEFRGRAENPVTIRATGDVRGAGIAVLNAMELSRLDHVRFENLSAPDNELASLTGALTFYKSPVEARNCVFSDNNSEDALNCVLSSYRLIGCIFRDIQSDAFDGDYSDGEIVDCGFFDCGNDAIDVSGSKIYVQGVRVTAALDKALSVGEGSSATVEGLLARNCEIAVASKDNSIVTISDLKLDSCNVGFTVFQKKSEFGPAVITINGFDTSGVRVPFLVEARSRLEIDGDVIVTDQTQVKDQLYGIKYGTSSK